MIIHVLMKEGDQRCMHALTLISKESTQRLHPGFSGPLLHVNVEILSFFLFFFGFLCFWGWVAKYIHRKTYN